MRDFTAFSVLKTCYLAHFYVKLIKAWAIATAKLQIKQVSVSLGFSQNSHFSKTGSKLGEPEISSILVPTEIK